MPDELSELMDDLARARDTEAAARMDVRDRKEDEAEIVGKRIRAESRLTSCIEQTRKVRAALNDYVDWQTRSTIEEADELMALKLIEVKRK
jgi:hypothetical protein